MHLAHAIRAMLAVAVLAGSAFVYSYQWYQLDLQPGSITASGERSHSHVRLLAKRFWRSEIVATENYQLVSAGNSLKVEREQDGFAVSAMGRLGSFLLTAKINDQEIKTDIFVIEPFKDSDHDGFPDVAELSSEVDRQAFRQWFGAIAESQYQQKSFDFYPQNQDCAGLIRYAYIQALTPHSAQWSKNHRVRMRLIGPDVKAFSYPDIPELGTNLFLQGDKAGSFGPFADARTIMQQNCRFLGYDKNQLQTGDLLFFAQQTEDGRDIWHSMIYLSPEQFDEAFVVYHTGPHGSAVPDGSGEVRKVLLSELENHPDATWHPVRNNQYFKGYYRLKIVD